MNVFFRRSFIPLTVLVGVLLGGCASGASGNSSTQPTPSEAQSPLSFTCSAPDDALTATIIKLANQYYPSPSTELERPSVVYAGDGRQAIAFSFIARNGETTYSSPIFVYVATVGDLDTDNWWGIPFNVAKVDPDSATPGMPGFDLNTLTAAHVALMCMMGG